MQLSSASVEGDVAAAAATAALYGPEAMGQEQHEEAEVCVPSEIWKVFQQVVKQVHIQLPRVLLISGHGLLATCRACPIVPEEP